jgi:HD-GYP domain-containing protein (c-di-GMP phosphodiesterase class II)
MNPLRASIHRILVIRIGVVTLLACLIFGTVTYVTETARLEGAVTELAQLNVQQFNRRISSLLDRPDFNAVSLQEELERFAERDDPTTLQDGKFVLARVIGRSGIEIAQLVDETHANIPAVSQTVDQSKFAPLGPGDIRATTIEINNVTYVGVAVPLLNSTGMVAAKIIGAFALSDAALNRMRGDILLTVAYVIGIILVTALALYPIISNLVGRMSGMAVSLLDANLETMQVLGSAIAKRDSDTDAHNYRVTVYSVAIAEILQLSRGQIRSLIKGALLHDVGKIGIRDDVLLKPGKLDIDEFEIMKTHVQHGIDVTSRAQWLQDAQDVVGGHHEKFGGKGYPHGLAGQDIPITARVFAIADVFDALTSKRPYKEPFTFDATMEILEEGRGAHFDPQILDAFATIALSLYEEYGGQDDDRAQKRLTVLSQLYFRSDIADLMI